MSYNYKHLSPGYISELGDKLTLNSKFYSVFDVHFAQQPHRLGDEIILFPQRIPKLGFFEELYNLETINFKIGFNARIYDTTNHLKRLSLVASNNQDEKIIRYYINWANICLRYGRFETIIDHSPLAEKQPFSLEIQLLKEAASIELQLSKYLPISIDNYLGLTEKYLSSKSISDREKIMLLSHLIVAHYRHGKSQTHQKKVSGYAKKLIKLLEKFEHNTPLHHLYCSVGYRGLAMVTEFGIEKQVDFLKQAEKIADNMKSGSETEELVALENRYTCYQSIAKWHQHNNDIIKAENYLQKMIQLDPYDSTGHSELAFHYLKQDNYKEAAVSFKAAMSLGPPGTGMNAYYYAKCLEKLDRQNDAAEYLFQAAELDPQAISPLLDLVEYYTERNNPYNAQEIVKYILSTEILSEQLEKDEVIKLHSLIN
jgi:tetratricopeptide (TPR) repeat protein